MPGINTGPKFCRREKAALSAMERIEQIGSGTDLAHTEGAVLASMAECGSICTMADICLGNEPNESSDLLILYIDIFEQAASIGVNCEAVVD